MSLRKGLTLVELLVVIIILVTLVATVIPVMAPRVETRRVREATRGVSTFLSAARTRAIELGRPVGVMITRMTNEPGAAMLLTMAEVPPPYAGLTSNEALKMQTQWGPNANGWYECKAVFFPGPPPPPNYVRIHDIVRVNHQGYSYQIIGPDTNPSDGYADGDAYTLRAFVGHGTLPWPRVPADPSDPVPFQIFRQPVRSGQAQFQLPDGVVIDLSASGTDTDLFHDPAVGNPDPIVFTFAPSGALDLLYHNHGGPGDPIEAEPITGSVHLLIGKRENVPPPPPLPVAAQTEENTNWLNLENLWVSAGPQTGQVGTAENAPQQIAPLSSDPWIKQKEQIVQARRFAREMHSMGGK